jgi:hypothetical protein
MTSRAQSHLTLAAAILALAACHGNEAAKADVTNAPAVTDNAVAANEAAAPTPQATAPAAAAPATPAALSADYMVGKWSAMNEDCAATLVFTKDGKVTTPIGQAKWAVAGDKLTIDYSDGSTPTSSTIKPVSQDRIEITTSSGRKETEKRC